MLAQTLQQYLSANPASTTVSARPSKKNSLRSVLESMNETYGGTKTAGNVSFPQPGSAAIMGEEGHLSSHDKLFPVPHPPQAKPPRKPVTETLKPEDSELIESLKGKMAYLRHTLNKADASASGVVNGAEFKSSLLKAGHSRDNDSAIKRLFDLNAQTCTHGSSIGTFSHFQGVPDLDSKGKTVRIDDFLKKLETTKTDSDMNELTSAKAVEDRRILRKALVATRQSGNSYKVLRDFGSSEAPDRLEVQQLKAGLAALGASISASEMDVVVEKVGVQSDGRVDLADFDRKLRESIDFFDKVAHMASSKRLREHSRYSGSARSSHEDLVCPIQTNNGEFEDGLVHSKAFKREQLCWTKLKSKLQENGKSVIESFDGNEAVAISQISYRLSDAGVQLGKEDSRKLEAKLKLSLDADSRDALVPLETFCKVAGIRLKCDAGGKPVHVEIDGVASAAGVFHSSRNSVLGNPTFSASMVFENKQRDRGFMEHNGKRRPERAVVYDHTYEPSKYWDLTHSDSHKYLMSTVPEQSRGRSVSPMQKTLWGQRSARRGQQRSSSAPPVKVSDLLVESGMMAKSGSGSVASSRQPAMRWASRSLADFINSASGAGSEASHHAHSADPVRRKNSLKRQVLPPSTAMAPPFAIA